MKFSEDSLQIGLPDTDSNFDLTGLTSTVEIRRDKYGIPHVRANNVKDVFFGQGFVTAQDRLWHMDYDRMRAYGRWAEYAGEQGLENDLFTRPLQIYSSVIRDYAELDENTIEMLDAYASGVNAFIHSAKDLPVEYELINSTPEQWYPWDCLAVYKIRHVMMGGFEPKLTRARLVNEIGPEKTSELYKGYQPNHLLVVPPGQIYSGPYAKGESIFKEMSQHILGLTEPDSGSNSWVLDGTRTKSGLPLIGGDPHRGLDVPNVYYQNHLACDEFDVIGMSFPGCPGFPHFGHNNNVAWCVTHAMSDYQDLYIEKFNPNDASQYEYEGKWLNAQIIPDTIKVRDSHDRSIELVSTIHGPIISGKPADGKAIAIKYTALEPDNKNADSIRSMLSVENVDHMDACMKDWVDPCNNFVFADVEGSIRYLNRGKIPIRPEQNVWLPVPGWTSEGEWDGYVKHEDLPRIVNPEVGFIVTANQKIVDDNYPYLLSLDYAPGYRAQVIHDLVKDLKNAELKDMTEIHSACRSIPAEVYCSLLKNVDSPSKRFEEVKNLLIDWDGSMNKESIEPTIYSAMRITLNKKLVEHNLGDIAESAANAAGSGTGIPGLMRQLEALFVAHAKDNNTELLPDGLEWSSLVKDSLVDGVQWLTEWIGEDIHCWKWGNVHKTDPTHTLSDTFPDISDSFNPPSIGLSGDGDTPHAGFFGPAKPFNIMSTSVARYVFDLSNWEQCHWIVPFGSSGHPGSMHYYDQMEMWSQGKLIPMFYDWQVIRDNSISFQVLKPLTKGDK